MPPEETAPVVAPIAPAQEAPSPAAQSSQRAESFDQTMARLGGYSPPPSDSDEAKEAAAAQAAKPIEAPKEEPKGKKAKAAAKAAAKVESEAAPQAPEVQSTPPDEMAQLAALAKKLGYELDTSKVTSTERFRLREMKRTLTDQLTQQERSLAAKYEQASQQLSERATRAEEAERVLKSLDPDAIAKFAGFDDYTKFQEAMLAKATDPNYLRIRELEKREESRVAEQAKQAEAQQAQLARQQKAQAEQKYLGELAGVMKASKNPLVSGLHDDPRFVRTILEIQRENYDPATRSTISPEQAIKLGVRGAQRTLEAEMRGVWERLHRVFGAAIAPAQEAPAAAPVAPVVDTDKPGAKPRPKTQVVPAATVEPAPTKRMNSKEFAKYSARRLAEAAEEDRRKAREGGLLRNSG